MVSLGAGQLLLASDRCRPMRSFICAREPGPQSRFGDSERHFGLECRSIVCAEICRHARVSVQRFFRRNRGDYDLAFDYGTSASRVAEQSDRHEDASCIQIGVQRTAPTTSSWPVYAGLTDWRENRWSGRQWSGNRDSESYL